LSLLSLPRAGSRSRRLVVCGAAAAIVLLPATAQAETTAPAPAAESTVADATAAEAPTDPAADDTSDVPAVVDPAGGDDAGTDTSTDGDDAGTADATVEDGSDAVDDGNVEVDDDQQAQGNAQDSDGQLAEGQVDEGTEEVPVESGTPFPEIDPAALTGLFVPTCDDGTLTTLTLQLDKLSGLLQQLKDSGYPIPDEAFSELPSGTIDIPVDDATLGELATELNAASAEFAELGIDDADLQAALAELPAGIRGDVEQLLGELQTGTVQTGTLRTLLMEVFPCPVEAPVAPVAGEDVDYLGYAPTGGTGSDGGSPLALLGGGAALLAGGGLFAASSLRSRAARA
jgi:hypothetical protein